MSRQAGKVRDPAAKRQTWTTKRGEQPLEKQALDLQHKAEHLLIDSERHTSLLSSQDKTDIHTSVHQLEQQAGRLTAIHRAHTKQLDTVEEHSNRSSSEIEEDDDVHSKLGSMDTVPYLNTLSPPFQPSVNDKSPLQLDQPPLQRFHTTPPVNPQFSFNLPPAMPNVTAAPTDPMAMLQSMFAQQMISNQQQQEAYRLQQEANKQQQEAMMARQSEVNRQQAEANQQLQLLLAKSLDRQLDQQDKQLVHQMNIRERQAIYDARTAIKNMREGANIVQYLEHFETEVGDTQIPLSKWKQILVSKLSVKAEKICAHLINSEATYQDLKRHLLANIGPSADELCSIMHGAVHTEFSDKSESQKLQHAKYISERYFLGIKSDNNIIEYVAVRLFKFHCHKRFSHLIKLSKTHSFAELLEMATSFDSQLDFEKTNKLHSSTQANHRPTQKKPFCEFCRKEGHAEENCFKKQGINRPYSTQPKPVSKPSPQGNQAVGNSHRKIQE